LPLLKFQPSYKTTQILQCRSWS